MKYISDLRVRFALLLIATFFIIYRGGDFLSNKLPMVEESGILPAFFVSLFLIPPIVAYIFTYRYPHKKKLPDGQKKYIAGISGILLLILFLALTYLNRNASLRDIQQTDIPVPTTAHEMASIDPMEKTINGITYYLEEESKETTALKLKDPGSVSGQITIIPATMQDIQDYWYDESSMKLYWIESHGEYGIRSYSTLASVSVNDPTENIIIRKVRGGKIYESTSIMDYLPGAQSLILHTGFGDGCGGGGEYWKWIQDKTDKTIVKHLDGCAAEKGTPSRIGYYKGQIILAHVQVEDSSEYGFEVPVLNIYFKNPISGQERRILDISKQSPPIINYYISSDQPAVLQLMPKDGDRLYFNMDLEDFVQDPSSTQPLSKPSPTITQKEQVQLDDEVTVCIEGNCKEINANASPTPTRIPPIEVTISGQMYRDINCNGTKDDGEDRIQLNTNVNIFKMPEYYIHGTLSTDANGAFSYKTKLEGAKPITLQPSFVSPDGYKSNPSYTTPSFTLSPESRTAHVWYPQVPAENVGNCSL